MKAEILPFYQNVQHMLIEHYTEHNVNGKWGQYTTKDTSAYFLNLEKIY